MVQRRLIASQAGDVDARASMGADTPGSNVREGRTTLICRNPELNCSNIASIHDPPSVQSLTVHRYCTDLHRAIRNATRDTLDLIYIKYKANCTA